jgi:hypothetical protein
MECAGVVVWHDHVERTSVPDSCSGAEHCTAVLAEVFGRTWRLPSAIGGARAMVQIALDEHAAVQLVPSLPGCNPLALVGAHGEAPTTFVRLVADFDRVEMSIIAWGGVAMASVWSVGSQMLMTASVRLILSGVGAPGAQGGGVWLMAACRMVAWKEWPPRRSGRPDH